MIRNIEVFNQRFIPEDLHHRDGHIEELRHALDGIPDPKRHEMVTIYGPSGSGKTTLARYVARRFETEYPDLCVGYIDCIMQSTQTSALEELFGQTRLVPTVPTSPNRRFDYLAALRDAADPVLVIVDEVDFLEEPRLIHALHGTRGVWPIVIGIDETELLANMHPGVRTRLQSARHIRLSRFTHNQLTDIVWSRIERGLQSKDIVRPSAVDAIVERAEGNAGIAIAILRACIYHLDPHNREPITTDVVDIVKEAAEAGVRARYADRLATHPRLLFELIAAADSISASQLKREYVARAPNPRGDSMRQNYLGQLQRYGLVYTTGSGRGTRYHAMPVESTDAGI